MSTRPPHTIDQQLNSAQLAISNSLSDPEVQSLAAQLGYPADELSQGKALYDCSLSAVNAERAAAGAQQESTRLLAQAEESARDAYQALAKVARAVFLRDKAQLNALGLSGSTPKNTAGFLASAYTLFDHARTLPALADYGYDSPKLQSGAHEDRRAAPRAQESLRHTPREKERSEFLRGCVAPHRKAYR